MGECAAEGTQRCVGLCRFAGHHKEGFVLQGGGDSLYIAKGFWITLFPCLPLPQPSLP